MNNNLSKAYNLSVRDSTEFRVSEGTSTGGGVLIVYDTNGTLDCSYNDLKNALDSGKFVFAHREHDYPGEVKGIERIILERLEDDTNESWNAYFYENLYCATTPDENLHLAD